MKKVAVFTLAALAVATAAAPAFAWGPHHHGGGMGMMGEGGCGARETPLTATQVKDIVEGKLAWRGEDLKVGAVTEKNGAIVAEITKPDGEVVRRLSVDPKSGRFSRVE